MSDVKRYWIPGPLTNYSTTANGFHGEVLVVAAADYDEREKDRRDLVMALKSYEVLRRAVNESTNECGPDCDDHGHGDGCPALSPSSWLEDQQRRIDALEKRLTEAEQEYQDARVVREQLEARLAEAERELAEVKAAGYAGVLQKRLAGIIGYCAQEGCDGEPYDTINAIATGEFDPCGSRASVQPSTDREDVSRE